MSGIPDLALGTLILMFSIYTKFTENLFTVFGLAWLANPQSHSSHIKISPPAKSFTKKKKKKNEYFEKCEVPLATTLHLKKLVKIIYLGLDIIIKLKFTTSFDRCAICDLLIYLS